jgi:hypothetical protein
VAARRSGACSIADYLSVVNFRVASYRFLKSEITMGRKARDPRQTGREPVAPWRPDEPCPCESGRLYVSCCLGWDGRPYKPPTQRCPPSPSTRFAHPRCYMRSTQDCDEQLSKEHFISASVLSHLGGRDVGVKRLPWLKGDDTKSLSINSLTSKILCKRHNEAFSPLDSFAGRFFSTLINIVDDSINRKTLSRRDKWYLISGDDLELWLLKQHSGYITPEAPQKQIKVER